MPIYDVVDTIASPGSETAETVNNMDFINTATVTKYMRHSKTAIGRLLSERVVADSSHGWSLHNQVPDEVIHGKYGILDQKVYYKVSEAVYVMAAAQVGK